MTNNLYPNKEFEDYGIYASVFETTVEETRTNLMKYYVATNKL